MDTSEDKEAILTVNTVTLARISNNDLYGCSTGYQDYTPMLCRQFALVLYYNAAIPIKVSVTDNS